METIYSAKSTSIETSYPLKSTLTMVRIAATFGNNRDSILREKPENLDVTVAAVIFIDIDQHLNIRSSPLNLQPLGQVFCQRRFKEFRCVLGNFWSCSKAFQEGTDAFPNDYDDFKDVSMG